MDDLVKRGSLWIHAVFAGFAVNAQSFDLEQFDQIFRPRVRLDARWTPQLAFTGTDGHYEERSTTAVFTFPVHQRWKVGLNQHAEGEGVWDLLKNAVRIRASQVMGNARFGTRHLMLDDGTRNLHSASLGALGISLTKKYRVLFWSVNANVSEEEQTFDHAVPRFNGIIGKAHVKGVRKQFFYGLALTASDGLNLPLPFIGGNAPMGDRWSFQYVLPLQAAFNYKASKELRFQVGVGGDGYRSGFAQGDERVNLNYTALRAFVNVRHRINRHLQLRAEVSGLASHGLRLPDASGEMQRTAIDPGLQAMVGVNLFFGASTIERLIDEVVK